MSPRVLSVNVATDAEVITGIGKKSSRRTGIDKRPVAGRIATGRDQLVGDNICDTKYHGGPDQAVYAYADEDARWWAGELGREVAAGAFGENLTTVGLDLTNAVIGSRWAVGTTVLELSCPRIPCSVFQAFWDVPRLVKWFTEVGRPGTYLRIHTPGDIGAGDEIDVVHAPEHGVTISETFRALTGDRSLAARLLEAPELPAESHRLARKWLGAAPASDVG